MLLVLRSLGALLPYPNKDSLTPKHVPGVVWLELFMGIVIIVPVSCRINLKTLTSPERPNSQLREMVWTAIKAFAIYTLTPAKLLLTSFRLQRVLQCVVQCEPQGIR